MLQLLGAAIRRLLLHDAQRGAGLARRHQGTAAIAADRLDHPVWNVGWVLLARDHVNQKLQAQFGGELEQGQQVRVLLTDLQPLNRGKGKSSSLGQFLQCDHTESGTCSLLKPIAARPARAVHCCAAVGVGVAAGLCRRRDGQA